MRLRIVGRSGTAANGNHCQHGAEESGRWLENDRQQAADLYLQTQKRIDGLLRATALQLLRETNGERLELFARERSIASPLDIVAGEKLDDDGYLSQPLPIGKFELAELIGEELPAMALEGPQ